VSDISPCCHLDGIVESSQPVVPLVFPRLFVEPRQEEPSELTILAEDSCLDLDDNKEKNVTERSSLFSPQLNIKDYGSLSHIVF